MSREQNNGRDENGVLTKFYASEPDDFLSSQKSTVKIILDRFAKIAIEALSHSDQSDPTFEVERPHNVFLIDGGRGSGKTYTLLSVEHALSKLSDYCNSKSLGSQEWERFFAEGQLTSPDELRGKIKASGKVAAETIRVVFPGDLIGGESIMESIFANLHRRVESKIRETKKQLNGVPDEHDDLRYPKDEHSTRKRLNELEDLQRELRDEVAQGWYFARRFGLEALIRDSLDYDDLTSRWATESSRSSFRIDHWRNVVSNYLRLMGKVTLVILVDDSDVKPELTEDVLHAIRMFLNHPQIVTVLAGNLKSMRDTLLYKAMERISPSVPALNLSAQSTAKEWRKRERQLIEEYLEKVLPPAQRIHIGRAYTPELRIVTDDVDRASSSSGNDDDFAKIAGLPLSRFLAAAQLDLRDTFLEAKFKLAIERELGSIDAPDRRERSKLEGYLAWWFFGGVYKDSLAPQTARQIATFGTYYQRYVILKENDNDPSIGAKRLPVALFDHPSNYSLIQRMSDEDDSLPHWLRAQDISSSWRDRRTFSINDREIPVISYTYNYLSYRLDVGLAMPVRDNTASVVPTEMLPQPVGRQFMRRFFQPRQTARRHRRIGISKIIDHAVVPGNCLYLHHLFTLPDNTFARGELDPGELKRLQSGHWEAQLADNWLEILEDRDEPNNDENLKRYFREMICESLRGTENSSSASLIAELDPPDLYRKQTSSIYEHFLRDEIGLMSMNPQERQYFFRYHIGTEDPTKATESLERLKQRIVRETTKTDNTELAGELAVYPDEQLWFRTQSLSSDKDAAQRPAKAPMRMVALYAALSTDLRRAWLAARIYEASPKFSSEDELEAESETGRRASLAVLGHRDRLTLFTRKNLEDLLKKSDWVKALIQVFKPEKLKDVQKKEGSAASLWISEKPNIGPDVERVLGPDLDKPEAAISYLFSAPTADQNTSLDILDRLQAQEEPADFERWTQTLRWIGREVCKNWPVDDDDSARNPPDEGADDSGETVEDLLFQGAETKRHMLRIFMDEQDATPDDELDSEMLEKKKKDSDQSRTNARSARNLVWFLYGIAPSLPAVIHAHIMSLVYEAELNWQLISELAVAEDNDIPKFFEEGGQRDETVAGLVRGYWLALDEIDKWASLIGSLAAILRYVKIKCLHLDIVLVLERLTPKDAPKPADWAHKPERSSYDRRKRVIEFPDPGAVRGDPNQLSMRVALLGRAGYKFDDDLCASNENEPDRAAWLAFNRLHALFRRRGISTQLAIFPDVSPSTLFGDKWISDIFGRAGLVNILKEASDDGSTGLTHHGVTSQGDDPVSVNGVFGETEQWLWSANRSLRKLKAVLHERSGYLLGEEYRTKDGAIGALNAKAKKRKKGKGDKRDIESELNELITKWTKGELYNALKMLKDRTNAPKPEQK